MPPWGEVHPPRRQKRNMNELIQLWCPCTLPSSLSGAPFFLCFLTGCKITSKPSKDARRLGKQGESGREGERREKLKHNANTDHPRTRPRVRVALRVWRTGKQSTALPYGLRPHFVCFGNFVFFSSLGVLLSRKAPGTAPVANERYRGHHARQECLRDVVSRW